MGSTTPTCRQAPHVLVHRTPALLVVAAPGAWFTTQWLIGSRVPEGEGIVDLVHVGPRRSTTTCSDTRPRPTCCWRSAPRRSMRWACSCCCARSSDRRCGRSWACSSCSGCGKSVRDSLPGAEGMIRSSGFPSLLVTYGVATDLFFSGHTALAVLGAIELARTGRPWLRRLGWALALFEAGTVLVLRADWTMDVLPARWPQSWRLAWPAPDPACRLLAGRIARGGGRWRGRRLISRPPRRRCP